jgi:hypothetical protein
MRGRIRAGVNYAFIGAGMGMVVGLVATERLNNTHDLSDAWICYPHPGTNSCADFNPVFSTRTHAYPDFYRSRWLSSRDVTYIIVTVMVIFAFFGALYGVLRGSRLRDADIHVNNEPDQVDDADMDEANEDALPLLMQNAPEQLENRHEQRLREAGYQGAIPDAYKDPVSRSIMVNPVILITKDHTTSQSYDEETVLDLIQRENYLCPLTRKPFKEYILNRDLKNLIDKWVEDRIAEMAAKPFNELPRDIAKQKLLEAQGFFRKRVPVKPLSEEDVKYRQYLSKTV